jgi:hypothetical protein
MTKDETTAEKPSRYAQLGSDGKRKVIPLEQAEGRLEPKLRIERSSDSLVLIGEGWKRDCSRWLMHPGIVEAFIFSLSKYANGKVSSNTVECRAADLTRGFFAYLKLTDSKGTTNLKNIDTQWVNGFIKWLGLINADSTPLFSVSSRTAMLCAFRLNIDQLLASEVWHPRMASDLLFIPTHAWPGSSRMSPPRKTLDDNTLLQLLLAAQSEALATMEELCENWAAMKELDAAPPHQTDIPKNAAEWRWLFKNRYPTQIPNGNWVINNDKQLWAGSGHLGVTQNQLRRPLYPSARDLIPFVLLLAFQTAFNPDVIRELELKSIEYLDHFGGERICFRPPKKRSLRKQLRTFAKGNPIGPDALVTFIKEWTASLRGMVPVKYQDHLFLMMSSFGVKSTNGSMHASNFTNGKNKASGLWVAQLKTFTKEHGLPRLSLAQIRPTALDKIHEITGGDLKAVQTAGGQRSPQVLLDHYTSDAARQRNNEALATIMLTRERLIRTEGAAVDPRKEPYESDKGCATPGFYCLDPFSSPMPSEIPGRLCQGFGLCPICPLACISTQSPYAVARALQLRSSISEAQTRLPPRRWLDCWALVAQRLDDYWLPLFSDPRILDTASELTLSPLPELE